MLVASPSDMSIPTYVLTVDSASARLFHRDGETPRGLPMLDEVTNLARPEARLPEGQRFSDSTPVSGVGGGGGGYHTYDDHRHNHDLEERRRFAKQIALTLADVVHTPSHVVVCVTHAMQSMLADALSRHCRKVESSWQTVEYTRLTPHELSKALADNFSRAAN
jgi:Protein required for attachment to host cells